MWRTSSTKKGVSGILQTVSLGSNRVGVGGRPHSKPGHLKSVGEPPGTAEQIYNCQHVWCTRYSITVCSLNYSKCKFKGSPDVSRGPWKKNGTLHSVIRVSYQAANAAWHVELMMPMLERYSNLMLDLSWRVIDDAHFATPEDRAVYVPFLNAYSDRILPGTDFLASRDKALDVYRRELEVTSRINRPSEQRCLPEHRPRRELLPAARARV